MSRAPRVGTDDLLASIGDPYEFRLRKAREPIVDEVAWVFVH